MKFTLKDYQEEAVAEVISNLRDAADFWQRKRRSTAFSLTATTGAGKTVMAAAVLETLFFGNDALDVPADPSAVVIWFSDDPSLNEQSRGRLLEASDRLNISDLVMVQTSFSRERLEPGKVYFLNTQKLGSKSLLVRGHDPEDAGVETVGGTPLMPDARAFTMWDTIRNTIDDPSLTLHLILDEAHRGMGAPARDRPTIVRRLVAGQGAVPGIPIVLGISATPDRFNEAMKGASGRTLLPNVEVDAARVQASGLLKDVINLDFPKGVGQYDTVLVRRGVDKLRAITEAWSAYAATQGDAETVVPLMVLQVPNTPDPDLVGQAISAILERWPELTPDAFAHVFGDHTTQTFGGHRVTYIPPERLQDSTWIRVLLAKDAISTGWDCPRAEVMVSFRPATDPTHITQLLGRMVRTPLARRIPGRDRLNAVDCLLPFFDQATSERVIQALQTGAEGTPLPGRRVLVGATEMLPNPAVPDEAREAMAGLPTQLPPRRQARPIKRLTALAHELAADGLLADAGKIAHRRMHEVLDRIHARDAEAIATRRKAVTVVEGTTLSAPLAGGARSLDSFVEQADLRAIEDAYQRAGRIISPDLARSYCEHLARAVGDDVDPVDALVDAHILIAALGLLPDLRREIEAEAEKLGRAWLDEHRAAIARLSDERQDVYRELRAMSVEPVEVDLVCPASRMQPSAVRDENGVETPLPRHPRHLLAAEDGLFPDKLNGPEAEIIRIEAERPGFVGWYRNPAQPGPDSLGIRYEIDGDWAIMRPDFLVFSRREDGTIGVSIIDPHGDHFADALSRLRGLAAFAEDHGHRFVRILALSGPATEQRSLDVTDPGVRQAIRDAISAKLLFGSVHARPYGA